MVTSTMLGDVELPYQLSGNQPFAVKFQYFYVSGSLYAGVFPNGVISAVVFDGDDICAFDDASRIVNESLF